MHKKLFFLLIVALLGAWLPAQEATGDTVVLKNGDRLTGTVTGITADKVFLDADAVGALEIDLAQVGSIATTGAVPLATEDGESFEARVQGLSDGNLRVGSGAATRDVPVGSLVTYMKPVVWSGSINAGGSISTGNTERRTASAAAEAIRRTRDTRLTLRASWDYGEDKKDTTGDGLLDTWVLSQRRTFGSAKFDYFLTEKLYAYGQASGENDRFADLKLRTTIGGGLGYQLLDEATFALQGEAGVSYVNEDRYPPAPDDEYTAARLAYSLRWDITPDVQFLQDTEAYPSLENGDDIYARVDSRLRTTLVDKMFAQLQHVFDYDNTPAPGNQRDDHRFILSVGWSF